MLTLLIALGVTLPTCAPEQMFRLPNHTIICVEKNRNKVTETRYIEPPRSQRAVSKPLPVAKPFQNSIITRVSPRALRANATYKGEDYISELKLRMKMEHLKNRIY